VYNIANKFFEVYTTRLTAKACANAEMYWALCKQVRQCNYNVTLRLIHVTTLRCKWTIQFLLLCTVNSI